MFKQYLTIEQAAKYSGISQYAIRNWIQDEVLTTFSHNNIVDPDEFDLVLAFREKYGTVKYRKRKGTNEEEKIIDGWQHKWLSLKEEFLEKLQWTPTYTEENMCLLQFETYVKKSYEDDVLDTIIRSMPEVIYATYINARCRIITNDCSLKTKESGYIILQDKEDKTIYQFLTANMFLFAFEQAIVGQNIQEVQRVPIYRKTQAQEEQEMLDYIFSHADFREKVIQMILRENLVEQRIVNDMIELGSEDNDR